jgi:hypothetical protein
VDHFTAECVGVHASSRATRFEALEPIRQGVRRSFAASPRTSRRASPCGALMHRDCAVAAYTRNCCRLSDMRTSPNPGDRPFHPESVHAMIARDQKPVPAVQTCQVTQW